MTNKSAAFKARMAERGLAQANEWIPIGQRALFRGVAKALRDGVPVTIGIVPSNPAPEPDPKVSSNPAPKPAPKPKAKLADPAIQAERRAAWDLSKETIRVLDARRNGYEARVLRRVAASVPHPLDGHPPLRFTKVDALIKRGDAFVPLSYQLWPGNEVQHVKPRTWRVFTESDMARLRAEVSRLHPDKGGTDTAAFMAAKEDLDRAMGRGW